MSRGYIIIAQNSNVDHLRLAYALALSIKATQKEYANTQIKISAQAHLEKFYETHQFKATGEAYLEDGIPHIGMILED